jgi:hypothetical protein
MLEAFDQYWKNWPDFTTWGVLGPDRTPKPAYWVLASGARAQITTPEPGSTLTSSSIHVPYRADRTVDATTHWLPSRKDFDSRRFD